MLPMCCVCGFDFIMVSVVWWLVYLCGSLKHIHSFFPLIPSFNVILIVTAPTFYIVIFLLCSEVPKNIYINFSVLYHLFNVILIVSAPTFCILISSLQYVSPCIYSSVFKFK